MNREKLLNKIAKATFRADTKWTCDNTSQWTDADQKIYANSADAALKRLAKEFRKWPVGNFGTHDITDELVDFLAGDVDEYVELDERDDPAVSWIDTPPLVQRP